MPRQKPMRGRTHALSRTRPWAPLARPNVLGDDENRVPGDTRPTLHVSATHGRHWCPFSLRADRVLAAQVCDVFALTRWHHACMLRLVHTRHTRSTSSRRRDLARRILILRELVTARYGLLNTPVAPARLIAATDCLHVCICPIDASLKQLFGLSPTGSLED